jgi:hypothetical protein
MPSLPALWQQGQVRTPKRRQAPATDMPDPCLYRYRKQLAGIAAALRHIGALQCNSEDTRAEHQPALESQ